MNGFENVHLARSRAKGRLWIEAFATGHGRGVFDAYVGKFVIGMDGEKAGVSPDRLVWMLRKFWTAFPNVDVPLRQADIVGFDPDNYPMPPVNS